MLNAIDDARILTYSGEVDTDNANFILNRINNHTMYMTEEFDEMERKLETVDRRLEEVTYFLHLETLYHLKLAILSRI